MKTILLIFAALFAITVETVSGQDFQPSSATFSFGSYSNVELSPDLPYFFQFSAVIFCFELSEIKSTLDISKF